MLNSEAVKVASLRFYCGVWGGYMYALMGEQMPHIKEEEENNWPIFIIRTVDVATHNKN